MNSLHSKSQTPGFLNMGLQLIHLILKLIFHIMSTLALVMLFSMHSRFDAIKDYADQLSAHAFSVISSIICFITFVGVWFFLVVVITSIYNTDFSDTVSSLKKALGYSNFIARNNLFTFTSSKIFNKNSKEKSGIRLVESFCSSR